MPLVNHPDSFKTTFDEIDRRLRALETAPGLSHSSVDASNGGAFQVNDSGGNLTASLGVLSNGAAGVEIVNPTSGTILWIDSLGYALPVLATPFSNLGAFDPGNGGVKVTGATFTAVFQAAIELLQQDSVRVRTPATTGGTDQGEIRLKMPQFGVTTSAQTITSAGGTFDFRWLHGRPQQVGPVFVDVEIRQTVGTGGVWAWFPLGASWYRGSFLFPQSTPTGL